MFYYGHLIELVDYLFLYQFYHHLKVIQAPLIVAFGASVVVFSIQKCNLLRDQVDWPSAIIADLNPEDVALNGVPKYKIALPPSPVALITALPP